MYQKISLFFEFNYFCANPFFYKSSVTCQCHLVIWNMCYPEMPVKYGVYHNVQTIDGTSTTYAH